MANKTISVPDDVLPIIDRLDVPFSRWVTERLREHDAETGRSFGEELLADAEQASGTGDDGPPDRATVGERIERSAPW